MNKTLNKIIKIVSFSILLLLISCNMKNNGTINQKCVNDFNVFFERFSSDSVFQKRHVKYPFKESYANGLENTKIDTFIANNPSEYSYIDFTKDKDAMNNKFGKYSVEIQKINNDSIHYWNIGYDNGINTLYKFKLIGDCWYLLEIVDRST